MCMRVYDEITVSYSSLIAHLSINKYGISTLTSDDVGIVLDDSPSGPGLDSMIQSCS